MGTLAGKTIALTECRRAAELTALVAKLGGVPYPVPAVREVPHRDRAPALGALDRMVRGEVAAVVFMTGVGTRAWLALAAETGRRDAFRAALGRMLVVSRGPKPVAALRDVDVRPDLVPARPTSEGVLDALADRDLRGRVVAVQLAGDDGRLVGDGLRARGAEVLDVPLYETALPEDTAPLARLVRETVGGRVDAVAFTSAPQVRHLFLVADQIGLAAPLAAALRERVIAAVVGPVCRAALAERGVTPAVEAPKGTMGALVHALAERLSAASR